MEVIQIAAATGLPLRRIRYVLEHQVLPGADRANRGHRVTRNYTGLEAFGIALGALLLEAGLRREAVARCLGMLVTTPIPSGFPRGQSPLIYAYSSNGPARMEVGDGVNLRMSDKVGKGSDVGWHQLATGAEVNGSYAPMVLIGIDIGRLRNLIRALEF